MKEITKDYLSLQENECRKTFALHPKPYIPQYWSRVSCIYDKLFYKIPTFRILFRRSPIFTSALVISRHVFYIHT